MRNLVPVRATPLGTTFLKMATLEQSLDLLIWRGVALLLLLLVDSSDSHNIQCEGIEEKKGCPITLAMLPIHILRSFEILTLKVQD
ncbi:conserved hypothetical protein [Ricinus communis]|uniref:Uncharacterized protein n=1 Tax=Ricinus communis TaxID=3988 RepID=B9SM62_RICCO|nr:conserved hypothetical protein [Ricinus communis]